MIGQGDIEQGMFGIAGDNALMYNEEALMQLYANFNARDALNNLTNLLPNYQSLRSLVVTIAGDNSITSQQRLTACHVASFVLKIAANGTSGTTSTVLHFSSDAASYVRDMYGLAYCVNDVRETITSRDLEANRTSAQRAIDIHQYSQLACTSAAILMGTHHVLSTMNVTDKVNLVEGFGGLLAFALTSYTIAMTYSTFLPEGTAHTITGLEAQVAELRGLLVESEAGRQHLSTQLRIANIDLHEVRAGKLDAEQQLAAEKLAKAEVQAENITLIDDKELLRGQVRTLTARKDVLEQNLNVVTIERDGLDNNLRAEKVKTQGLSEENQRQAQEIENLKAELAAKSIPAAASSFAEKERERQNNRSLGGRGDDG